MIIDARERLHPVDFERLGMSGLYRASTVLKELGPDGREESEKNQFGEAGLIGDIACEAAVIGVLKKAPVPFIVVSEEHGTITTGENPQYMAVLDGIDGSKEYKSSQGTGRYATMLGIFSNADPTYGDYAFQGIMEHANNNLFYATKGKGAFVRTPDVLRRIRTSDVQELNPDTRVYFMDWVFDYFDADKSPFVNALDGIPYTHLLSTACHYADLASGVIDLVIEPTRKGNLEPAAAYGLVKEAGGVVVTFEGEDLGNKRFREYGQATSLPIISAATPELLQKVIRKH